MLSTISMYRRNQVRAYQLSSSVKSANPKSINYTKENAKTNNLGYYNTIVKALTDESTAKNLNVTYYGNALSYMARYQDPSNFASVLSLVTKNEAQQVNPLPFEDIRTVVVNAVLDAVATRSLSTSMSIWTEAAKQDFNLRKHELRSVANLLAKDSLNPAKKRVAENIAFWRCHQNFDAHPAIAANTTIFTHWQTLPDDEKRRQFLKFTQSLQYRTTSFSVSERQTTSEAVQDMIDILKEGSSLPVNDSNFPTDSFHSLRMEFPRQVDQILSNYATHGLHEDMLFFFRLVSRALTEEDQWNCIRAILRSYNLRKLPPSSTLITHRISDIEQHISELKKVQEELMALINTATNPAPVSLRKKAMLQSAILDNLAQRYNQLPKSSNTNFVNYQETVHITINPPEETFLVQYADAQLRAYVQEAAEVSPNAAENLTLGVADLMDSVVHLTHKLYKEWMLVHSLSLLEEILSGKLPVPLPSPSSSSFSSFSSTSSASTTDSETNIEAFATGSKPTSITSLHHTQRLKLHISTYKTLLSFADQILQNSPLLTTLLYHGVNDFLSKYKNEWMDPLPLDRRLLFPSVKAMLSAATRDGTTLTKADLEYIMVRFHLNAKTNQHPEEALQWLREIRAHHKYLLPLPLFIYKQIVQNLSQIALLRPSQIVFNDSEDTTTSEVKKHDSKNSNININSNYKGVTDNENKMEGKTHVQQDTHDNKKVLPSVSHNKQFRKFQEAIANWKRASDSLDFSLDQLAINSHRLEDALARNPEVIAEWLLRTMRVQDKYGVLTAKELAMVVPLFVPFAKHVVHAYREAMYRKDHCHVNGNPRKLFLELSHIPMDAQLFQEAVIDRVLRFLRKQLRQHLKDMQYPELRYLGRRPVFNELWYEHVAPQELMVKNIVRLYCQAGLIEEAMGYVHSLYTGSKNIKTDTKVPMQAGVTASVLESIFMEISRDHHKRDHDHLEALLMQLVTSAALNPGAPAVKQDIFKKHVKKTNAVEKNTNNNQEKKSFFAGFTAFISSFSSAFSTSSASISSSSSSSSSASGSSKAPVVSQRMVDAMVRAKIFDAQYSDALDLCLELYQQYGTKVSLGVLQMLQVVCTKNDAILHESDRLIQVVSYLYPSEAYLLQLPDTPENETEKLKSAFARGNSGMRRARQWWRDKYELKESQKKKKISKKSWSSDV